MFRLGFLLILLAAIAYLFFRFGKLTPEQKKHYFKLVGVTGLFALLVTLVITGRLSWLIAIPGALLPLMPKAGRLLLGAWPRLLPYFRRYQQNKHSSMQTQYIRLQIDVMTGELKGDVLRGAFQGQKLQSMSAQALLDLLEECKQQDEDSLHMLMSYLDRVHPGWSGSSDSGGGSQERSSSSYADTKPDIQQARDILGVSESADKKEIIKAHKRLMQKLHPDRGGSDYLARQINQARDTLLKSL